jgi:5-oxoprolinase (ATP-hydrolysing)
MGGPFIDVAHFNGEYKRQIDNQIAGNRIRVPILRINIVDIGDSYILFFDRFSFHVVPKSAGVNSGPACYRRGGLLKVEDANVMVGKISSSYFPIVFRS